MNCTNCGSLLAPGAMFCGKCGTRVAAGATPTGVAMPPPPPQPASSVPGPAPVGWAPETRTDGTTYVPVSSEPVPEPRHGRRAWLFVVAGVVAIAAAGAVGWLVLRSNDIAAGGSSKPEDVAASLIDALNHEDLAAAAGFVSPDELPGLAELMRTVRDAAKAEGINGLSPSEGVDVNIVLDDARVTELADGVARVDLRFAASFTGSPPGVIGQLIDGSRAYDERDLSTGLRSVLQVERRPDVYVVVVKESGKWFVSPMLTVGAYLAEAEDLASPDYDAASERDRGPFADDVPAAFDQLADAISRRDIARAGSVLAPGEARFVRVFERAIDDLLGRIEEGTELTVDHVRVEQGEGDQWILREFDVVLEEYDSFDGTTETREWLVEDGCVDVDEDSASEGGLLRPSSAPLVAAEESEDDGPRLATDEGCFLDGIDLSEPLPSQDVLVHTERSDGGVRIAVARTVMDYVAQISTRITRQTLLMGADLEAYDDASPMVAGTPSTVTADGREFTVLELPIVDASDYLVQVDDPEDVVDSVVIYEKFDRRWDRDSSVSGSGEVVALDGNVVRAVVWLDTRASGSATVTAARVQRITAEVGTVVKPNLAAGGSILIDVPTPTSSTYEFVSDTPGALIQWVEFSQIVPLPLDATGAVVPEYDTSTILVTNTAATDQQVAVTIRTGTD